MGFFKKLKKAFKSKPGRIFAGVSTLGVSELSRSTGVPLDPFSAIDQFLLPDSPQKPGRLPKDNTEQAIAAARATEIEERKKRRVSLITSPGGAFLKATDLSKPSLTLGS